LLRRYYPASTLLRPCPTPAMATACRDVEAATLALTGLPRLPEPPFQRAVPTTPADQTGARVDCFPARTAFPKWPEGRYPHRHFRGLLRLHSRYGPPDRSAAQATFVTRLQLNQLPDRAARQLPDQSTTLWVESSSTDRSRLRGARPISDIGPRARNLPTLVCWGRSVRPPVCWGRSVRPPASSPDHATVGDAPALRWRRR
jgi:hypothetical protein